MIYRGFTIEIRQYDVGWMAHYWRDDFLHGNYFDTGIFREAEGDAITDAKRQIDLLLEN